MSNKCSNTEAKNDLKSQILKINLVQAFSSLFTLRSKYYTNISR